MFTVSIPARRLRHLVFLPIKSMYCSTTLCNEIALVLKKGVVHPSFRHLLLISFLVLSVFTLSVHFFLSLLYCDYHHHTVGWEKTGSEKIRKIIFSAQSSQITKLGSGGVLIVSTVFLSRIITRMRRSIPRYSSSMLCLSTFSLR